MQTQTVTFERVFSVLKRSNRSGSSMWTEFGFELAGKKIYSACVYGHPEIVSGTPLLLALPYPDDWKNICGWVDLSTEKLIVEDGKPEIKTSILFLLLFMIFPLPIMVLNILDANLAVQTLMLFGILALSTHIGVDIRRGLRKISARRALNRVMMAKPKTA